MNSINYSITYRNNYTLIYLAIICLLGIGFPVRGQDSIMTLADCIKLAENNSIEVLRQQNNVALAGEQVMMAYGQFLPDANFGAGYNYALGVNDLTASTPTLVNSNKSLFNYQLTSSVNIFSGLANRMALRNALLNEQGEKLTLERAKQLIAFDVAQTYLQVVLDMQLAGYAKDNLAISMKREEQIAALAEVGRKIKSDLFQQQAATSQDKLLLIAALQAVRKDKIALFKKLRMADSEKHGVSAVGLDSAGLSMTGAELEGAETLIAKALNERVDLKKASLAITSAEQNITKAKSGFIPKLNLNYGLFSNGAYYYALTINGIGAMPSSQPGLGNQLFGQVNGMIGLSTSWALFDKNVTRGAMASSKINLLNAKLDYENLQLEIKTSIQQVVSDYVSALQELETASKGLVAATSGFQMIEGRYQQGSSNFIELQNAQQNRLLAQEVKTKKIIQLHLLKLVMALYEGTGKYY